MSLNSMDEAAYRLELARGYLERVRRALTLRDFADAVSEAQLSIENSAKSVISCFRIPSWSNDPSEELRNVIESNRSSIIELLGLEFLKRLEELAEITHIIAPEHGRSCYGDIQRRVPPWRLYSEGDAQKALERAEKAYETAERFIKVWHASSSAYSSVKRGSGNSPEDIPKGSSTPARRKRYFKDAK